MIHFLLCWLAGCRRPATADYFGFELARCTVVESRKSLLDCPVLNLHCWFLLSVLASTLRPYASLRKFVVLAKVIFRRFIVSFGPVQRVRWHFKIVCIKVRRNAHQCDRTEASSFQYDDRTMEPLYSSYWVQRRRTGESVKLSVRWLFRANFFSTTAFSVILLQKYPRKVEKSRRN